MNSKQEQVVILNFKMSALDCVYVSVILLGALGSLRLGANCSGLPPLGRSEIKVLLDSLSGLCSQKKLYLYDQIFGLASPL